MNGGRARNNTGTIRELANGVFEARIRVDRDTQRGFALTALAAHDEAAARARCATMADAARRLRLAGHSSARVIDLMKIAARARAGRPWEAFLGAIDQACTAVVEPLSQRAATTVKQFGEQWRSGELHRRHADHVGEKEHKRDAEIARVYVDPVIGSLRVAEVSLDDCESVMEQIDERSAMAAKARYAARQAKAKAEGRTFQPTKSTARGPRKLAPASRRHVAQYLRRLLHIAVYPARLREANPIPRGWLPRLKSSKAKEFIYPDEDRKLLACTAIPLERRLRWGILAREGMRAGELAQMTWLDVDVERGRVDLDENKTKDPRAWDLDPGVLRALRAWRERFRSDAARTSLLLGGGEDEEAFGTDGGAKQLRADLVRAGVTREKLFTRSASRLQVRAHDLRSTMITVSLAVGRTETWVQDRTGHKSSTMINLYRRNARTWSGLGLRELAPLDEAIPELSPPERDTGASCGPGPARARAQTAATASGPRARTSGSSASSASRGSDELAARVAELEQLLEERRATRTPSDDGASRKRVGNESTRRDSRDLDVLTSHEGPVIANRAVIAGKARRPEAIQNPSPQKREGSSPSFGTDSEKRNESHAAQSAADSLSHARDSFVPQSTDEEIERDLARALADATSAGRWDVATLLARQLEARQLARAGNVVTLADAKRPRR